MKKVKIYTTTYCPYCLRAKQFLSSLAIAYEEIDVEKDAKLREEMSQKYNWYTVPMILVDDTFIGGYDDMMTLHNQGKFLPLTQ